MNLFTWFQNAGKAGMKFSRYKGDNLSGYQSLLHDMRLDIRSNKIIGPVHLFVALKEANNLTGLRHDRSIQAGKWKAII